MKKVYTSACVIIPPEEKWEKIQEIRKKYDRQINRWMPHINLLYPFIPESRFKRFEKRFEVVCSQIESFEIILKNFKYFTHRRESYTIWLEPEPNEPVKELQLELLKILPECNDVNKFKGGYTPHLSVGQIYSYDKLIKLIEKLQNSWNLIRFEVDKIYFIAREQSKDSSFEIKTSINLKS
ncbi:MAG: 2'-5' RNA ligase family protein [Promethearchaeota archaeon]